MTLPDSLTAAPSDTVQRRCLLVDDRLGMNEGGSREQPAPIAQVVLVSRSGEHLHTDRLADSDVSVQQFVNSSTYRLLVSRKKFVAGLNCRSGSRGAGAPQLVQVAVPTRASHGPGGVKSRAVRPPLFATRNGQRPAWSRDGSDP